MGASTSGLLPQDVEELSEIYGLEHGEIRRLYKRFRRLDKNGFGSLSSECFLSIPELAINPLVTRFMELLDEVNFRDFVKLVWVFSQKGTREEKVKFAFQLYDVDQDGSISEQDVFHVLRLMTGKFLSDEQLRAIAKQTVERADSDGDGVLSKEEFAKSLAAEEDDRFMKMMTIDSF
eukprot:tig00000144_g9171.t1